MQIKYLALLVCLSLSSCGFQLRGTAPADNLEQIYIADRVDLRQINTQPVSAQLIQTLETRIDRVFTSPETGVPGLVITSEQVVERPLSLSANLLNREIEIAKRVDYQILSADGEIVKSDWLISRARIMESQNSPAVNDQERMMALENLNNDLGRQLISLLDAALANQAAPASQTQSDAE